jgi:hypothetical protein
MIRAIIESMMGQWGRSLMYFYDEYSLWINLVVVLYGIWVVMSWANLKKIRKFILVAIAAQLRNRHENSTGPLSKKELASLVIPWESSMQQARFPFIARQSAFLPRRLSMEQVKEMLPVDDMAAEALKILQGKSKQRV